MTESSFRQLLLRFAYVPVVSICGVLIILGIQIGEIETRRVEGTQATYVMLQGDRVLKSALDEETGIRGYLVTHDPAFLQNYEDASDRFSGELSELRTLTSSSPSLSQQVSTITRSFMRFDAVNQQLLKGDLEQSSVASLLEDQRHEMDTLRAEFADLISGEHDVREKDRQGITELLNELPRLGMLGGAFVAGLLIWHGIFLFRSITRAFRQQLNEREIQRDSLETTLHSIGDAVIVSDTSGNITLMNPTAEEVTGWKSSEAIGHPLREVFRIVHETTRLPVESPADKVIRLGACVTLANHTLLIRKDGTEVPIDDSAAPIRDRKGALSGIVLVFRSVAERRQAAKALRESQERLDSIYSTSLEHIGILNPAGQLLDCNRASLAIVGKTREEVVGMYFWNGPWFAHTPGMPELIRAAVERAAAGQPTSTELHVIQASGEVIPFDFALTPVFDSDGKVIFLVPEGRDITQLKQAERALVQSEKLAAVGRLASSIAHEINNPLEAVTNLLYLARHLTDSPEVEEYLATADHELRRVSAIANQTLRFHKQTSSPQPIHAEDMFSTVLSIYEGKLRNSNISVELLHRTKEPIVCFAGDVRQVLSNLVGNAIDAMPQGGRLLMRTNTTTDWETNRKGIVFTVADTGNGISPEDQKKIFEAFFTTKGFGGTGLGLWVSQEVVERHEGTLRVRSSQALSHSGSVFRFFLPFL